MSSRVLRVRHRAVLLEQGIAAIQREQKLDTVFAPEVLAAAADAARNPRLPDLDRTDIAFVTVDPPGSLDLDQALHLERDRTGYVVHYAIADVAAFVTAGDPIDVEARRRGESLYGADSRIPLHPTELCEAAASLLPGQVRPAFLWTIRLDSNGAQVDARVERARVRSTERLDYAGVQTAVDAGTAGSVLMLLKEVGGLRLQQEAARGGVNLPMPEQIVDCGVEPWRLEFRGLLPAESWNAQISLLTGFAAAAMMIEARVGILRTLPPAEEHTVARLRRTAQGLKVRWPPEMDYPAFIRSLDPSRSEDLAMVVAAMSLLRGAGYAAFDGDLPQQPLHAALASPYAHVTAPLRRLVDRFGLEICAAHCAGTPIPEWARGALGELPDAMKNAGHRASAYEGAVLGLVEASTLQGRVGERFSGVVVDADAQDPRRGEVILREPAVAATVTADRALPVGEEIMLVLSEADPSTRRVRFTA